MLSVDIKILQQEKKKHLMGWMHKSTIIYLEKMMLIFLLMYLNGKILLLATK